MQESPINRNALITFVVSPRLHHWPGEQPSAGVEMKFVLREQFIANYA